MLGGTSDEARLNLTARSCINSYIYLWPAIPLVFGSIELSVPLLPDPVFRYKTIIDRGLRARTFPSQKTEARVACSALNRMTRLGMPVSQRIA